MNLAAGFQEEARAIVSFMTSINYKLNALDYYYYYIGRLSSIGDLVKIIGYQHIDVWRGEDIKGHFEQPVQRIIVRHDTQLAGIQKAAVLEIGVTIDFIYQPVHLSRAN